MSATATFEERFCREKYPGSCTVVIFGASGNLAKSKLFPALHRLFCSGLLHPASRIVAASRRRMDKEELAPEIRADANFLSLIHFCPFDPAEPETVKEFSKFLDRQDSCASALPRLYYLALPASAYPAVLQAMASAGLFAEHNGKLFRNLILEKPFGYDVGGMKEIRKLLKRLVSDHQIYLIDHYLGKDEIQNILMLRFANTIFSGVWNRKCIESITIGVSERAGIGSRAGYFDRAGIVRDMFQSHLLLALGLCIMRRPAEFDNRHISRALDNALKYITPVRTLFTGQYEGYLQEKGVPASSGTLTCADILFKSSRCDWNSVRFRLFAGKRLAEERTFIKIVFRSEKNDFFGRETDCLLPGNELTLEIKPGSGISLSLCSKKSGPHLCVGSLTLSHHSDTPADGYSRMLLDCLNCDRTFFPGFEVFISAGAICDEIIQKINEQDGGDIAVYSDEKSLV